MVSKETVHQILAVLTAGLNEISIGIGDGWVAPVLGSLKNSTNELSLDKGQTSWIASLDNIGRIFGAIVSAALVDIIGRKWILASCALIFFSAWSGILVIKSVAIIYTARILYGVAKGMNDCTNSIYVGEIASPVVRGHFGTISSLCYYVALVGEYVVATYLSYNTTAAINAGVGFLTCLTTVWLKEPVQFLLMKNKHKQAEKNYLWLKGFKNLEHCGAAEFEKIKKNVEREKIKKTSLRELVTASENYKSIFIVVTSYLLVGAMGFSPIAAYTSQIFKPRNNWSTNDFTIVFGLIQFIVALITPFFVCRLNRRTIIIYSGSLIGLSHLLTALLFYINLNVTPIPEFSLLIFSSITLFAAIYGFMYPAIFLMRSELFPLSVKAIGGCVSLVANSGMSFLTTKIFLLISDSFGIYTNFIIFAILSYTTVLFVYLFLPETRNKTLIEIQNSLENKKLNYKEVSQRES